MADLNYVDFGYWDYGYAEGDIKSIQFGIGEISAIGNLNAQGTADFSGNAFITATGTIVGRASYTVDNRGSIPATGTINAILYKYGEEWNKIPEQSDAWNVISEQSNNWTEQTQGSNTWRRLG